MMIDIVVLLEIADKEAFDIFESRAIKIMQKYNGRLVSAFEPDSLNSSPNTINEVHILQFETLKDFKKYRNDEALKKMRELREKAIKNTTIYVSGKKKNYA